MRRLTLALAALFAAPLAQAVAPPRPAPIHREGEVLVRYRGDAAQGARAKADLGLRTKRALADGRTELLELPGFLTTRDAVELLRADPAVAHAEPNFRRYARAVAPADPLFAQQWGLRNIGQANFIAGGPPGIPGADLNLLPAWDPAGDGSFPRTGSPEVIVAIIDDAFDLSHPDLTANVLPGRNFIACQNPDDTSPIGDEAVHGTLVAGCAVGRGDNGLGVAGVAWQASLLPMKFGYDTTSHLAALEHARASGAHIINASFGGPGFSQLELDKLRELDAAGILYVAAAGNDDSNTDVAQLNYPANYDADNVLAVAATNRQDDIASFSQYGPLTIDVAAPGLQIITTDVGGTYRSPPGVSGTSFAAPYVAGVAALLKSHVLPTPDAAELKARLIESGTAVPGANPRQRTAGGRVDAAAALELEPRPSLVLRTASFSGGDDDGVLDPGETVDLDFTVRNLWLTASGVTAQLASDSTSVSVNSGPASLGVIAAGGEAQAAFSITVAPDASGHRYVTFALTLTADGGYTVTRSYIAEIGAVPPGSSIAGGFSDGLYDDFHAWHTDVPIAPACLSPLPCTRTLIVRTSTAGSDIDLLARHGSPPQYNITVGIDPEVDAGFFCTSGTAPDCQDPLTLVSGRRDGHEAISVENPQAGAYHLVIVNFAQQVTGYTVSAQLVDGDLRPDAFGFAPHSGVPPNRLELSDTVTITGIDRPTFITVAGGEYRINGGTFTTAEGLVDPGDRIALRVNSGSGSASVQVTVGGVTAAFDVNPLPPPVLDDSDSQCTGLPFGRGGGGGAMPPLLLLVLLAARWRRARARR